MNYGVLSKVIVENNSLTDFFSDFTGNAALSVINWTLVFCNKSFPHWMLKYFNICSEYHVIPIGCEGFCVTEMYTGE